MTGLQLLGPAALAALLMSLPQPVLAQARERANFDIDRYSPGMDREAVVNLEAGSVPLHLVHDAALSLTYAHNPLLLARDVRGDTERAGDLVGHRLTARAVGAIGLFGRFELGVELPVIVNQGRGDAPATTDARLGDLDPFGSGDLRLAPKVALLRRNQHLVDVAFIGAFTVPTAWPRDSYLGDRSMTVTPTLAASRPIGPLRAAVNVGYTWRRESQFLDLEVGPEIVYGAGAAMSLERLLGLPVEAQASIFGATSANEPFGDLNRNPLELLVQGAYDVTGELQVFAGGGPGLVAGFGTPDYRVFAGVRYAPRPPDTDGDGVADPADSCAKVAEDDDGVADADGCPETDADEDGVPDPDDRCPEDPGVEDEHGCPAEARAELRQDRIAISDTVYFETGRATIQARSYGLLEQVANIIKEDARIHRVIIEGHTDNVGSAQVNLNLSQARAESVRKFLIERGVDADKLVAKGVGSARPIASNSSERGRARNRRVEFLVEIKD